MATIRIKNLKLKTVIGTNDSERNKKQAVVINVTFGTGDSKATETDNIDDTSNYRTMTKKIISAVEESEFFLIEKLAKHILNIVMEDGKVLRAKVEVDKPGALRFTDSVSVEVTARKEKL